MEKVHLFVDSHNGQSFCHIVTVSTSERLHTYLSLFLSCSLPLLSSHSLSLLILSLSSALHPSLSIPCDVVWSAYRNMLWWY